ncbi:tRNA uridine-5-carboxymethylaminomethyl(34) synthesis GTPase MnmE [Desulfocurvus vexinensis]|uniref:tRNA uridine-5-carboxymethylaminomethyl(34) synthesis GTPase MnmE n=1 Tax=Desulfocurvus vexinensis TaxID=399548 RepID=UPI00048A6625|nr:tRNA uridine-5-carboxymethylaminomethyl(34) synthesis GTPase MnmE [Desulfocurvus vexinensis]
MRQFAMTQDTIAAIATPPGCGGVGIVRVSGPGARAVGQELFESSRPGFAGFLPYRLHHGWVRDAAGRRLDEVLAAFMPGPGSYTGEDVLELQGHGGPAVLRAVLGAALACGARMAEPGEFTYRAFCNGRMDLTQAEAVAELIAAPTAAGAALAQARLAGGLGRSVAALRARLEELRAQLCVAVDFPDDEVECLAPEAFEAGVRAVGAELAGLVRGFERGRVWREGVLCVLAGRVNAGKSSLMNALLGRERAIVTDIPGTTRDWIEEALDLEGLPVRLVDTAGLRETGDAVERAGLERGRELVQRADVVLLVVDRTRPLAGEDQALASELGPGRVLAVLNKTDLAGEPGGAGAADGPQGPEGPGAGGAPGAGPHAPGARPRDAGPGPGPAPSPEVPAAPEAPGGAAAPGASGAQPRSAGADPADWFARAGFEAVAVSARTGQGLTALCGALRARALGGAAPATGELVPNMRQARALAAARDALVALEADIRVGLPYDLLGVGLESACTHLAEITGEITPSAVLDSVFGTFCIGK